MGIAESDMTEWLNWTSFAQDWEKGVILEHEAVGYLDLVWVSELPEYTMNAKDNKYRAEEETGVRKPRADMLLTASSAVLYLKLSLLRFPI